MSSYPDLGGIVPAGNVYLVSASSRLISPVVVTLRYGSQQQDPPSQIFASENSSAVWKSIGSINSGVPYTVAASAQTLGYFLVGYPPDRPATRAPVASGGGGPPVLALVAMAAAVLLVLAGIPLVTARRRVGGEEVAEAERLPQVARNLGGARRPGRRRGRR